VLELIDLAQFIYATRPIAIEAAAAEQLTGDARGNIAAFVEILQGINDWTVERIDAAARAFAETKGLKLGKVAQPLRAALTGRTISPGIFEVMVLIGRDETLARLSDQARRS
jgi:glutamyl-tRNA synthetase